MPLNKEARIKEISNLIDNLSKSHQVGTHKISWNGDTTYRDVYKIPIEYLVYNKYNGRILSRIKSLETQNKKINIEDEKDFKIVQKLLFDSHPSRNRQTEKSIKSNGQEKPGIVTKDGVVIDGNRRFMFLNRLVKSVVINPEKFKFFEAVILPVNLSDDVKQIRQLETSYQMGEDKKLDYNPIEKYLKAQELKNSEVSEKDISSWMGETESVIKNYLETMKTMDDYLDYLGYQGIYTQLDGREDWFISLTKWLNNFRNKKSSKGFDGYGKLDVDFLQIISYDYIRAKHGGDGKRFRKIAEGAKEKHIFGNKDLWTIFRDLHRKNINPIKKTEGAIKYNCQDLKSHLDDRDSKFTENCENFLKENLNDRISDLNNKEYQDKPERLINKAFSAINEVDTKAKSFSTLDTQKNIKKLHKKTCELLLKDVSSVFEEILSLLNRINQDDLDASNDEQRELIRDINKQSFEIKKRLGG